MTAADEGVRLEGLIEWHRRELYQWQRIRAYEVDHDQHVGHTDENVAFHTEAISTLTRMEAEVGRLREALEEGRRAIGNHWAPNDCYATGPVTGDTYRDLVECPACSFLAKFDALTPQTEAQSHD